MKCLLLILGLLTAFIWSQQVLVQQLHAGEFREIRRYNNAAPQYYLCGAGVLKRANIINKPQTCWKGRRKLIRGWVFKCDSVPPVVKWVRINGISFNYCHFQDWQAMINKDSKRSQEGQQMEMCPQNMYVYGFKTKLTERDGMAGLILLCKNLINSKQKQQILVFDGQGSWRDPIVSGNLAVASNAKIREGFVNGLSLQMTKVPQIHRFNLKYTFPLKFNTTLLQIGGLTIENYEQINVTKQIQFIHGKELLRIWKNARSQLHGIDIPPMFSWSLLSTKIKIPCLKNIINDFQQRQQMIEGESEEKVDTFKFGMFVRFKVGILKKTIIVPPCMRYVIKRTVQATDIDIPYSIQLGYTNGMATWSQSIDGVYSGTTIGEVNTAMTYERIC